MEKRFSEEYLERYPHLGLKDWPVRHKKIYRHKKLVFKIILLFFEKSC